MPLRLISTANGISISHVAGRLYRLAQEGRFTRDTPLALTVTPFG